MGRRTLPTAASPRSTSFTLLLGLGAAVVSDILSRVAVVVVVGVVGGGGGEVELVVWSWFRLVTT
jgi:hypothetical protein